MTPPTHRPTPLTVYLPFNRNCLRSVFVPAKAGTAPAAPRGLWLVVQDQGLLVVPEGDRFRLPEGERPAGLDGAPDPIWLGTLGDTPCWVIGVPKGAAIPAPLQRESGESSARAAATSTTRTSTRP
jgi:hypothetical protein